MSTKGVRDYWDSAKRRIEIRVALFLLPSVRFFSAVGPAGYSPLSGFSQKYRAG